MGIRLFSTSRDDDRSGPLAHWREDNDCYVPPKPTKQPDPNPDPTNYKIIRSEQIGNRLLVMVVYPNCTTFEGKKILLFEGITLEELVEQKFIDPHFSQSEEHVHPIARFIPTEDGWAMAKKTAVIG